MSQVPIKTTLADEILAKADQQERIDAAKRREMMKTVAQMRWKLATEIHETEDGSKMNFERFPFQKEIYQSTAEDLVIFGGTGWGKFQKNSAKVHTPSGWKRMGDIRVGDYVTAFDGTSVKVLGVFPQGKQQQYRVTFCDGRSTEAGGEHLWEVHNKHWRQKWKPGRSAAGTAKPRIMTTLELKAWIERPAKKKHLAPTCVPLCAAVPKPFKVLPIDPYALGLLIGDGGLSNCTINFTTADLHLGIWLEEAIQKDFPCELVSADKYSYRLRFKKGHQNPLKEALRKLGLDGHLSYTKFIPRDYLEASVDQRWELMRGLMDTDGTSSPALSYSTSSKQLADDVCELVRSLGGIAKIGTKIPTYTHKGEKRTGAISYKVNIRHPEPRKFFRLQRKLNALPDTYQYADQLKLAVKSIEPTTVEESTCILIDHPRHLYITDDYIVTHNTIFSIIDDFAKALCGLRVIHVCDKAQKRNSFVLGIIDPLIHRIPFYAAMLKGAAEDRKAEVDSAYAKHFGDGMMYFLGANSESDFYSYRGDSTMVDEMQLCDLDNLAKLFGRRTGSFYRFQTVMGNPKEFGSAQNQNIHWQFLESDQRQWKIPCPHCHEYQRLSWGTHFVKERTNDFGAIVEVEILDKERADQEELEIRPICQFCGFPMWRLHPEGKWVVTNPGKRRHGYQLSNLYNPEVSTLELLGEYRKGFHNPGLKASFHQNQLGEPYAASGANITEEMLEQACTGLNSGVMPYAFIDVSDLEFHDVDVQT